MDPPLTFEEMQEALQRLHEATLRRKQEESLGNADARHADEERERRMDANLDRLDELSRKWTRAADEERLLAIERRLAKLEESGWGPSSAGSARAGAVLGR
jgi:hypothetical protein